MIRVWPRAEALDEALAERLDAGEAITLGFGEIRGEAESSEVTWDALLEAVAGAGAPPLDPVIARLALREACARAARGTWLARVAGTRGFLSAAARFIADCERAALSPDAVRDVDDPRVRVLSEAYAHYARTCDGLGDSVDRRRGEALRRLRGEAPLFVDGREIVVMPRLAWEPVDVDVLLALARRAGTLRLELPYTPGKPAIFGGLEPMLAAFEAREELLALEPVLVDPADRAAAWIAPTLRALGGREPAAPESAPIEILAAPTPEAELRAVAARARACVDRGAAPEEIVVAARAPEGVSALLSDELARVGLRLDDRRRPSLSAAPPARLALALIELVERDFPREDTLAIVGSTYVDGDREVPSHRIARAARELGVRELSPGRAGGGLDRLARRKGGAPVAARLRALLGPVAALPSVATLAEHAAALGAALHALGVARRARRIDASLASPDGARVERALARDQAAVVALDELLDRIPRAARAARWARAVPRRELAALLADLLAETSLRPFGARGGAVRLVHLRDLAARRCAHVIVPRLVDGETPARARDDGLYGERERRALDRALGRRLFWTGAPPGERTPFERLLLIHALACATESVTLTYATSDGDGRVATRSPFLDELGQAAPWIDTRALPLSPVPPLRDAAAPADLLARVALELQADPVGRLPSADVDDPAEAREAGAAFARAAPDRLARIDALSGVERARWAFFAGRAPPGPHAGVLPDGERAGRRVGGDAAAPLRASQIDRFANCPFTFFAGRVLGVDPEEEGADAPSRRRLGSLAHRCLELFYRERAAAGALPLRGDDGDLRALDGACERAFADAAAEEPPGDPALWQLEQARIRDGLWRLISTEAARSPSGGTPTFFELPFGLPEEGALPPLAVGGVFVGGRIDRVDLLPDGTGAVVIDYKSGSRAAQQQKLRSEHALQLPIYAAAARAGLTARGLLRADATVDGLFLSLRDGQPTSTLRRALGDEAHDLERRVTERVSHAAAEIRAGRFPIAPVDCKGCSYRSVCRVVALREEESS